MADHPGNDIEGGNSSPASEAVAFRKYKLGEIFMTDADFLNLYCHCDNDDLCAGYSITQGVLSTRRRLTLERESKRLGVAVEEIRAKVDGERERKGLATAGKDAKNKRPDRIREVKKQETWKVDAVAINSAGPDVAAGSASKDVDITGFEGVLSENEHERDWEALGN